jgi:hypothetical protein
MIESVTQELNKKDPSDFHKAVLDHTLSLVKMSRGKISQNFRKWDMQDQVFHGVRYPDVEDARQAQKGDPVKMVVPNTFAQVMTFTSFLFLLFNQNKTFFELIPTGDEDYGDKQKDCELTLQRDIRQNEFNAILFQLLLDIGRFGSGIMEDCWTRDIVHAYVPGTQTALNYNNVDVQSNPGSEWQEFTRFEGNLIRSVSPYRFFPDTRYPLSDFQRGEFCACEEEYSISQLRGMEESGEVAGIDNIGEFSSNLIQGRGDKDASRFSFDIVTDVKRVSGLLWKPGQSEGTVIVTKAQVKLTPSKFTMGNGTKKLGPEEYPILYHVWYANDNRVIRLEPAYYWHNRFSWSVGEFTPDMQHTVNFGLADLIYRLQDVITWHINSRITDVRRNLKGRFIIDPGGVDTSSVDGDGDIYLRSNVSKAGVDRWMKQLDTRDITQAHLSDADVLGKIMQTVTGVNDNIMGQYNTGRRSAQEARTVLSGAAGRMKLHGFLIWEKALQPLGKRMLSNLRQSLPFDAFARIIGGAADPQDQQTRYQAFQGTPEEIICGDDYFTFDSTLSSEKGFMAQSLQDLLSVILQSDPVAASQIAQNINPVKIVDEIQYLRGAGNVKRFQYTPEEQAAIQAQQERQQQAAEAANKPKIALSLAGKMTPEQEAAAANSALGINSSPGISQDGGEKVIADRMKPVQVPKPASNGASK